MFCGYYSTENFFMYFLISNKLLSQIFEPTIESNIKNIIIINIYAINFAQHGYILLAKIFTIEKKKYFKYILLL